MLDVYSQALTRKDRIPDQAAHRALKRIGEAGLETTTDPDAGGSSPEKLDRTLRRFLRWAALLIAAGWTFLDYWNYNRMNREDPREWADLLAGRGIAPAQYRIGVFRLGAWLARAGHWQLRHAFAAIDFVCLLAGVGCVLALLTRTARFRTAARTAQWLLSLFCLAGLQFYLLWTFWFQKPETMATFAVLAGSALLCARSSSASRALTASALLALAVAGATVRADAVVAFHAGMLLACLLPASEALPLGRGWQAFVSAISIVAAAAVQFAIAHFLYPTAQRNVSAFQLVANLHSLNGYLAIVLALTPWGITLWFAARRWRALDAWTHGVLLGSAAHFALFYTLGMAEEVRIFLPFAMATLPISATLFDRSLFPSEAAVAPH